MEGTEGIKKRGGSVQIKLDKSIDVQDIKHDLNKTEKEEEKSRVKDFKDKPLTIDPEDKLDKSLSFEKRDETEKLDPFILKTANQIIDFFKQREQKLIAQELSFDEIEQLKSWKKEVKVLLEEKKLSLATQLAIKEVVKQYDNMVASVEVLQILQAISRSLRRPEVIENSSSVDYPFASRFEALFKIKGIEEDPISDLAQAYGTNKDQWKAKWSEVRKNIWTASLEAEDFLKQGKKITFATGSKSSSLPFILKVPLLASTLSEKPALIPTGQLLRHQIVPLAGELAVGISNRGVNQTALSGMRFAGLNVCLRYASSKEFQFNADKELQTIYETKEIKYKFDLPSLHVAVLRLLLMGEKKSDYSNIKNHLKELISKEPKTSSLKEGWSAYIPLIGLPCKLKGSLFTGQLQRGQVIAISMGESSALIYGLIAEKYENGTYRVIVEKNGRSIKVSGEATAVMESTDLLKEAQSSPSATQQEQELIQTSIKNNQDQLETILQLFETVKPLDYTTSELDLIHHPFPVVWASVTLKPKAFGKGVKHEHIVKGKAELGKDLQLVFTNRENVDKLQALVKEHGVQVLSFEAAYFILGKDKESKYKRMWD